jgi:aminotransferase
LLFISISNHSEKRLGRYALQSKPRPAQPDIRAIARLIKPSGNLVQGQNDVAIHPELRRALNTVVEEGLNHYSFFEGVGELRHAVAEKIERFNNLSIDPDATPLELLITPGGTGGIVTICHTFLRDASAVLFEPYYPYHKKTLETCNAHIDPVKLQGDNLELDVDELRRICREGVRRTDHPIKAIIVCSPANPTGRVFTREEMHSVLSVAEEFNLLIISDEVYEHFTLTPGDHVSMASLPGAFERTLTVNSFSKSWAVSGWRLGYLYGPGSLVSKLSLLGNVYYVCTPTPLQQALARVVLADPNYYDNLRVDFGRKREILRKALEDSGFRVYNSRSAFYLWARIPDRFGDATELNDFLIRKSGVAGVPGGAFMESPEHDLYMRWCFAREDAMLEVASDAIVQALR